jgi:flagellar biosynthesis/type III secretory pathway protein FliH
MSAPLDPAFINSIMRAPTANERLLVAEIDRLRELLASFEPSPEDIAEAEARGDTEAAARDRAEKAMLDDAYARGFDDGRREGRETA